MRSKTKQLLLILLMLALPVQAFASASLLGCAFSHQAQSAHHAMEMHVMSDETGATCHEPDLSDKSPTSNGCKHCSACYLASSLLVPAVNVTPALPATRSAILHVDDTFIGFIADGPERPPRTPLA